MNKLSSIKVTIKMFLIICIALFFHNHIMANWQSAVWLGGVAPHSGGLIPRGQFAISQPYKSALRIYLVKETGNLPLVSSRVKDFRKTGTGINNVMNYTKSSNGLGTRWQSSFSSSGGYSAHLVEKNDFFGEALPQAVGTSNSAVAVREFFTNLNANKILCKPDCLTQFLIDYLKISDSVQKDLMKNKKDYYIIVEPVLYSWLSQIYTMQTGLTPTDAGKFYNHTVLKSRNFGPNVGLRYFNHLPNSLILGGAGPMNSIKVPSSGDLKAVCPSASPFTAAYCFSKQVYYQPSAVTGDKGIGIVYLWGGDIDIPCNPDDPNDPCDDDPCDDDNGDPGVCEEDCQSLINGLPASYFNLVRWGLNKGHENYQFDCCNEFKSYIDSLDENDGSLIYYKSDYEKYCESRIVTPPPENGKKCNYTVSVSCVDCTDGNQIGGVEDIRDWECIFLSDQIAPVDPPFKHHYIDRQIDLQGNPYCKVYCREDLDYEYPDQTFTVYAGMHFTVGSGHDYSGGLALVPHWGNIRFQGVANCRPTLVRDMETSPLAGIDRTKTGDHEELYIDHVKFTHDWKKANEDLGDAWDKWQIAVLQKWAKDNAQYVGRSASCGVVFTDSRSGTTGCYDEQKMYSCSYGTPKDGGATSRKNIFECRYVVGATPHYKCSQGYLSGSNCIIPKTCTIEYNCKKPPTNKCSYQYPCYDTVPAEIDYYSCSGGYTLFNTNQCYYDFNSNVETWQCNNTNFTRHQLVQTPFYKYSDANIRTNVKGSSNFTWCSVSNDVTYRWVEASRPGGELRRYVHTDDYRELTRDAVSLPSSVFKNASQTIRRPAENPTIASLRQRYEQLFAQRTELLAKITACQEYNYDYSHLLPEMVMGYKDYKYPVPEEFPLIPSYVEENDIIYFQRGLEGGNSSDVIDKFECSQPSVPASTTNVRTTGDADSCPIVDQNYPDNDSFYYTKNRYISYDLEEETYRYVVKHNLKGQFDQDAVSVHERPRSGNFIDVGYPNMPIHYYQGPDYPTTSTVWIRLNPSPRESFGPNNQYDQFVFGRYKPASINPAECLKYECEFNIRYRYIPPEEPDPNSPNPGLDILVEFRPIDLQNPFPGYSGDGRTPGWNWNDETLINTVIRNNRDATGDRIYFDKDPMYSITLTFNEIVNVRSYNRSNPYNDFNLDCRGGLFDNSKHRECRSSFIDQRNAFIKRASCLSTWDGCHKY